MRRIYPEPAEVPPGLTGLAQAYACPRDWLRVNMVSSLDGAATVRGRVGTLTGPADQQLLVTLRMLADVVLVGASTIRTEGYGPIAVDPRWQAIRRDGGQAPIPPLAIVTVSGDLDLDAPVFTEAETTPLVIIPESCPRRAELSRTARVIPSGDDRVDLVRAVSLLRGLGYRHILGEGGPHMFSQLCDEDLVDEVCLTLAPVFVGGEETRITAGGPLQRHLRLSRAYAADDYLFARYLTTADATPSPDPGPPASN